MKAGPVSSPVRQDPEEGAADDTESVDDIALQLSREDTPENGILPLDEPSSVLASKIIRAHDNPSPPPFDLAHPGTNGVPGKGGHFSPPGVSVPLSPFRSINLLERLDRPSYFSFDPPHPRTSIVDDRAEPPGPAADPPCSLTSPESCPSPITSVPLKGDHLESANAALPPPTPCAAVDLPSRLSQHVCEPTDIAHDAGIDSSSLPVVGLRGQLMPTASSSDPETLSPSHIRTVDSSVNLVVAHTQGTTVSGAQDDTVKGTLHEDYGNLSVLKVEQGGKCGATAKRVDASLNREPDSLSSHSANVLAGFCGPSEPASSVSQSILTAESVAMKQPPETPPRTPKPFVIHPDFSRSTIQRPAIVSTFVREKDCTRKSNSPLKLSFAAGDICRTPAQRVPIDTLARGASSLCRVESIGLDQSRSGRFLITRSPVFTRTDLEDPARSPAKRIPVMDLVASQTKEDLAQGSPTRLAFRARSASVEPRPVRSIPTRSRSVEPCAMILKHDNCGKESIFPTVPMIPRSGTKLPFPLVPGQKQSSDLPPPIPEEHDDVGVRNTETDATLGRVTQSSVVSQLRQPSTNSRIPRIGNKPYARSPPKSGMATISTVTANTARAPRILPFRNACKNSGTKNDNAEAASTQLTDDQRLMGTLKRKRGAELTVPSNSHSFMIRQVVPGILSEKYAPKPAKFPSQVRAAPNSSSPKAPQPLKFRKVVDGMLSARYGPKANSARTDSDPARPLSPLSELSSSSNEEPSDIKVPSTTHPPAQSKNKAPDVSGADGDLPVTEPFTQERSSSRQNADTNEPSCQPRRTSRARKPAQQQYVLDVFNGNSNSSTRPPPARRKPQSRTEGDGLTGMSANMLKSLTTLNTMKNQQTIAVLATEVIRKAGLRPESPTVKARTILQKQRDERDRRRRERAQRRARTNEEDLPGSDTEGQVDLGAHEARADHDADDCIPQKHCRGPGDEEDYETPERPERIIEPLRLEGADRKVERAKQVKWHQRLSTAVYTDEVNPEPKSLAEGVTVGRGCLAPTSKNLSLDPLGNLVDIDSRPVLGLVTEQIVVKKYLYDNDVEPEPIPAKTTRSRSKKNRS